MTAESQTTTWFDWAREQSDPKQAATKPEALDDLLVIDASFGNIGGLVCSSILAEMGARVPMDSLQEQNWWDRGSFRKVQDPVYGEITLQGPVWKMTESPPRLKWACRPVGADNTFIYSTCLGIGGTALEELKARGIV